jgi:hypothetical protein
MYVDVVPAEELFIFVLCPRLAPVAHAPWCSFRNLFITPEPGRPGDWCGTVTDLDQVRERFPGVLFHACLREVLQHGISQANATITPSEIPPPSAAEGQRRPRGGHPYGRA